MNLSRLVWLLLFVTLTAVPAALAATGEEPIPEKVPAAHWTCKELKALGEKYEASGRLPDAATTPDATVDRSELAQELIDVLGKVADKCAREGEGAVPPADLARLAALKQALQQDLETAEGYLKLRDSIDRLFVPREAVEPAFVYKYGINGFLRGEGAGNFSLPGFTYAPDHAEGRFLYRVKPYAYWHPADWLDIHAEGQGYGFRGGNHQEYSKVSLYQGFAEVKIPGSELLALKGGRQEFSYGSAFVLGPDSFFDGLSFDAARLRVRPIDPLTVDLLVGAYATPFSGGVEGNLAGAYATWAFSEGNTAEAYAFRDSGSTDHHGGEYLATWGLRGTAKIEPFSLEFEPAYQSGRAFNAGRVVNDRIDAFGGHMDMDVDTTFAGIHNHLFLSYAYGSGSSNAANGVSAAREFRTPDNDSSLMGDMSVVGDMSGVTVNGHHASGLQIYTLGWGVDITKEVNFTGTGRFFRANDVEDGFSRTIGTETDFTLTWNLVDNLSLIAGYDRFFTGDFFRDATGSGKDIDYGYLMLQFDLSRKKLKQPRNRG